MSDDRRKFTDWFDEAKVQVAQGNDGDALSAAADVKPTARGLGVLAAVVRRCPPERCCACVADQSWREEFGIELMADLRRGVFTCKYHLASFEDLKPLLADDELVCDVCGAFADEPISPEDRAGRRRCRAGRSAVRGGLAFLASTQRPDPRQN